VPRQIYVFGDCRIDPSARELRRAEDLVVLSPKVFDCLAYLAEHRDRAVGRDELVAAVWGKTEISDTLLGQTILKARRAVGDSASEQRVLRTIPRFGYAWVAELAEEPAARVPAPATSAQAMPSGATREAARRGRRNGLALSGALVAAAIGIAALFGPGWLDRRGDRGAAGVAVASLRVAVLPVQVDAPSEWGWVRLGLMDAISARLGEGGQPVVPSDNVIAVAKSADARDVGRRVRAATGAKFLVASRATWNASGWNLDLSLDHAGSREEIHVHAADVLLAGREASDRLLALLGRQPPPDGDDVRQWSDTRLLQQVEAALLTDDLDGARRLLESAPARVRDSAEAGLRFAKIDFRSGEFEATERRLQAMLARTPAESAPVLRARILDGLGNVAIRLHRTDAASGFYEQAISLLENRQEPSELGQAYMGRGIAAQIRRNYDAALADFSRARVAFEMADDDLARARVDANEGMLDVERERYAPGAEALEAAARRFERFGTLNELGMTSSALVGARLALLEPTRALAASDRAWSFRDRVEDAHIRTALSINRALALAANGRTGEARELLGVIAQDTGRDAALQALANGERARIEYAIGHWQAAADLAFAAIPALDQGEGRQAVPRVWLAGIRALRRAGLMARASEETRRLSEWTPPRATPALQARVAQAEALVAVDSFDEAGTTFEAALEAAGRLEVPADIAEVVIAYGSALIAAGRLERAGAVVGRVARWADQDFDCALLQVRLFAALGQATAWRRALATARRLAGDRPLPPEVLSLAASRRP
jgi:DNA-binding winged helix-turn-helix (wHTH) protein/tetratricopeptide (TPR) repeat protein